MSSIANILVDGRDVDKAKLRTYLAACEIVSVKDPAFGALGDGNADDTAAIQAAIDWAIYRNDVTQKAQGMVFLPAGRYKTSDTLHLGYGTSYSSVVLEGEGIKYFGEDGFCGTVIVPTFNDRPAIAVQGGRNTCIRNMSLVGQNRAWILAHGLGSGMDALEEANWVDDAFPAASSSRYAPYAGIAIDPYSGDRPAMAYPTVNYPSFLGNVAQYNKRFSSKTIIENVQITGFVVGVANQPSDADGNGDFTKFLKGQISECQFAFSICNTQSRLVHIADSEIWNVHTGIVTAKHGRKNGKPEILVQSTTLSKCIQWINAPNTAYGAAPKFGHCYGELVYRIGLLGNNSAGGATSAFDHCHWAFGLRASLGEPAYTLTSNDGPGLFSFRACGFERSSAPAVRLHFQGYSNQFSFENCEHTITTGARHLYEKFALNATSGITFSQLGTEPENFSVKTSCLWDLATGANGGSFRRGWRDRGRRNELLSVYAKNVASHSSGDAGVPLVIHSHGIDKARIVGAIATAGRSVTFATGKTVDQLVERGGEVGDVVWDSETGVVFYVRSRTGAMITMEAQTGYDVTGALLSPITKTGYFYLLNCRTFAPTQYLQGDAAAGSNVIMNVGNALGNVASLATDVLAGDYIATYQEMDNSLANATASRITAVDAAARTITTAGNQAYNAARKRIPLFWRAAPANA